jgi:hypothetical protein
MIFFILFYFKFNETYILSQGDIVFEINKILIKNKIKKTKKNLVFLFVRKFYCAKKREYILFKGNTFYLRHSNLVRPTIIGGLISLINENYDEPYSSFNFNSI